MSEQSMTEAPVETASAGRQGSNSRGEQGFAQGDREQGSGATDAGHSAGDSSDGGPGGEGDGDRGSHGMGQSKSSRRRRRKRKGKGPGEAAAGAAEAGAEGGGGGEGAGSGVLPSVEGEAAGARDAASRPSAPSPQGGFREGGGHAQGFNGGAPNGQMSNGQMSNAPGGTKRWKKKFRERNGRPDGQGQGSGGQGGSAQPGNSGYSNGHGAQGGGGGFRGQDTHQPGNNANGKRKQFSKGGGGGGQQRSGGGGRGGFVGPMDHSYRAVNGNVFDAGASTIDQHSQPRGRHHSDSQPIDYSQGRVIPIAPGTPTRIYFFIEDLFFTAKISETARKLGVKVAFIKNDKDQLAELTSGDEATRPALIVFDLNNANAKPMTLIPKLRTKLKKTASIVGFLSTLQGELRAKAVEAGCDSVMPRAAFSQNLPNLLRRYGLEEAEDGQNFNQ